MSKIKKGETVMLKSGEPIMTVQSTGDYSLSTGIEDGALCAWFDENKPMEKIFDVDGLEIYKDE